MYNMNFKCLCVDYVCKLCSLHPSSSSSVDEVSPQQNGGRQSVPATKWLATSVPATKWLVTNCTSDETVGDELPSQQNGRRRNGGDERGSTPVHP